MKNKMGKFLAITVSVSLLGCIHLQKDEERPLPSSEVTSVIKSSPEESSTNMETPGVSPEEAGTDADVQIKF